MASYIVQGTDNVFNKLGRGEREFGRSYVKWLIVSAECGDYVIEDYPDHTYLSTYKFVPHQDQELERRIMENHKKHA